MPGISVFFWLFSPLILRRMVPWKSHLFFFFFSILASRVFPWIESMKYPHVSTVNIWLKLHKIHKTQIALSVQRRHHQVEGGRFVLLTMSRWKHSGFCWFFVSFCLSYMVKFMHWGIDDSIQLFNSCYRGVTKQRSNENSIKIILFLRDTAIFTCALIRLLKYMTTFFARRSVYGCTLTHI